MKAKWTAEKQMRSMREGMLSNYREDLEEYTNNVKVWVANPSAPMRNSEVGAYPAVVSVDLYRVGLLTCYAGTVRVLGGDAAGWEDVHRSVEIVYWVRRMEQRLAKFRFGRKNDRRLLLDRLDMVITFGVAFSLYHDDAARWLADSLLADVNAGVVFDSKIDWSPLSRLIYTVAGIWRNRETDATNIAIDRTCQAYDDLIANFSDGPSLGDACDRAAEYHVTNGNTAREREQMDFYATFGEAIPWEVLCLLRLRREKGLPDPAMSHPFLLTPLMSPPLPREVAVDSLLKGSIEAARSIFPDL